jgi:hypothetical protein
VYHSKAPKKSKGTNEMMFNDRRQARRAQKAASATTRTQIGMMAKGGTLRSTTPPSKNKFTASLERSDNKAERMSVKEAGQADNRNINYKREMAGAKPKPMKESMRDAAQMNDMTRKTEGKSKY